jgi:hypothetical protein
VFQLIRAAASRLFPPARGTHRQHRLIAQPFPESTAVPRTLRPHHRCAHTWTDDGPLLRPYVLSADEWTRRRGENGPQAVSLAS